MVISPLGDKMGQMSNGHLVCPMDPMDMEKVQWTFNMSNGTNGHGKCPVDIYYVQWTFSEVLDMNVSLQTYQIGSRTRLLS